MDRLGKLEADRDMANEAIREHEMKDVVGQAKAPEIKTTYQADTLCAGCQYENRTIVIRSPRGAGRREVELVSIQIPDLWHVAMYFNSKKDAASHDTGNEVLECWHLCHDLLANLRGEV